MDTHTDMCAQVQLRHIVRKCMCADMFTGMCTDMYIDMIQAYTKTCGTEMYVCRLVYRHVYTDT